MAESGVVRCVSTRHVSVLTCNLCCGLHFGRMRKRKRDRNNTTKTRCVVVVWLARVEGFFVIVVSYTLREHRSQREHNIDMIIGRGF